MMTDKTGDPVNAKDVEDARQAVRRAAIRDIMKLPPYLAVELPNVLRCLDMCAALLRKETSL